CSSGLDIQTNKGVHHLNFYISDMYVPGRCSIPPQSIHEEEIKNKISCYPNPLQDVLNITNLPQGKNDILLIDMLGREVYKTHITGQTEAILPLQRLKKGMYILLISNKEEIVFKHKLLKE
ncbi:MAG: T9SS type A sorting domain-containing protein, partial [Bacteroidia bacterium]